MKPDKMEVAPQLKKAPPAKDLTGNTPLSVRRSLKCSFEWPLTGIQDLLGRKYASRLQ
ncbi:hypothetical protein [Paraburkholderia sp. BR14374]|uniref:hypothetical protein n=1 Tax=Paraburkholderia sp. BR14374 TaxID=3237007 RepID=UPI0034CE6DAA